MGFQISFVRVTNAYIGSLIHLSFTLENSPYARSTAMVANAMLVSMLSQHSCLRIPID